MSFRQSCSGLHAVLFCFILIVIILVGVFYQCRMHAYFRKMSTEEKKNLGTALTRLSPEDLTKALEIVAEDNPSFQAMAQEVDLDIDAQVNILSYT